MKVPFIDLKVQYSNIQTEIDQAIASVIRGGNFISPKHIGRFEEEFADYIGVKNCIACGNGTDSIEILLKAMGIGFGDEVLVPAISWVSTSSAVSAVGATPIFVDIHPQLYTIDLHKIEEKINERTKAIIPVHLYGQPVDMVQLMRIAKKHGLKVLEDCAQAHGASFKGQKVGTFGDGASFSFYPTKNLGAYGDAGAMLTNDSEIAEQARMIANCGQKGKHNHLIEGRTSRMSSINAAVLSTKLQYLDSWNQMRVKHASLYDELLSKTKLTLPKVIQNGQHVYHIYAVQTEKREQLMIELDSLNIGYSIHYPTPLPLMPCYGKYKHTEEDFPVASQFAKQTLSLPMYAEMTDTMVETVTDSIIAFSKKLS